MAAKHNIKIDAGSDFHLIFARSADNVRVPIANVTAKMQIRDAYDGTILVECTSAGGRITFEDSAIQSSSVGVIHVFIPATATEDIAVTGTEQGVYDVELQSTLDTSSRTRVLEGTVTFRPQVTKDA